MCTLSTAMRRRRASRILSCMVLSIAGFLSLAATSPYTAGTAFSAPGTPPKPAPDAPPQAPLSAGQSPLSLTQRVSLASDGSQGNHHSSYLFHSLSISADGRYVAFDSQASNLVPDDNNNVEDVFVRDRTSGTTVLVSVSSTGAKGNGTSINPSISGDGRYVAFESDADNLVPNDTNLERDIFVRDLVAGTTERVNLDNNGGQAEGGIDTGHASINTDGQFVVFHTYAQLVATDNNGSRDIYLRDRGAGTIQLISSSSLGDISNGQSYNPHIYNPGILLENSWVAFESTATNLVPNDTNGKRDIFVRDIGAGTTIRASVSSSGEQANGDSYDASITGFQNVAFDTYASNLVAGDTNGIRDVYFHSMLSGITERMSLAYDGSEGQPPSSGAASVHPSLDWSGRYVAFSSDVNGLVPGDDNDFADIFLRDRQAGTIERVSLTAGGLPANAYSWQPTLAQPGDHLFTAFGSSADNLVNGDTNDYADVFVRDRSACSISYSDVPADNTFYPSVRCLSCLGIISGYNDSTFRPNNDVTRGQLAKIVSNAAGLTGPAGAQIYEDVPPGSTFYDWIQRLSANGAMGGYQCGGANEPCVPPTNRPYFRPGNNATRGQIAKIVSNAAGFHDTQSGWTFQDVPSDNPFYMFVERLALRGVMGGYQCGGANEPCVPPANRPYFRPGNNATRGQVSKIVANTFYPNCAP